MRRALLLSGGVDSTAVAYWMRPEIGITIDYGQLSAKGEIRAATVIAEQLGMVHRIVRADCSAVGSGDLSPTPPLSYAPASDWWPYRNQLLITLAAGVALAEGADSLLIGAVANDSVHVDGTATFVEAMAKLLEIQEGGLSLVAPANSMTTADLIAKSGIPTNLLLWSHSCHTAPFACGQCRGCFKRLTALLETGNLVL